MIDFRYHLVSIVSIFLALAVGILLGAGPLKEDIGVQLTQQMTVLRAEKTQLRTDLANEKRGTSARDTFSSAVAPVIMKDQLSSKTVALVIAPGTDPDLVTETTASLVAAGAKVGSSVTLTDDWADPAKRTARNALASQFADVVKVPAGPVNPDQLVATVLAHTILAAAGGPTSGIDPATSAALEGLKAGDLIKVTPDQISPASSIVFLGAPVNGSTQADKAARLSAYVQLVRSLNAAGSGSVVATATNTTERNLSGDLVAALRKDAGAVKVASTVDNADLAMGQTTLVLALAQQYAGGGGHYGLAGDATAVSPAITEKK